MPKIPNIVRFKGDNETSFDQWCLYFELQLKALGVADDKRKDLLVCCTEGSAFTFVSETILATPDITYSDLKGAIKDDFCGEEYRTALETKLRNRKFRKGLKVTTFARELRMTVSELYAIKDKTAVEAIATNQVLSSLDDQLQKEVHILQVAGNVKLENLLELIDSKVEGNPFGVNSVEKDNEFCGAVAAVTTAANQEGRLNKLEKMMETLIEKVEAHQQSWGRANMKCEHCNKIGHTRQRCYRLKTCFKCGERRHISKCCRKGNMGENIPTTSSVLGAHNTDLKPGKRVMIKVKLGNREVHFLYDPGSQFTILARCDYDILQVKPPLQSINQVGSGVTGTQFSFDGLIYLNLGLEKADGTIYTLEYEPVLVSSNVMTSIFGINTERRFDETRRQHNGDSLTFVTKEIEEIRIKMLCETVGATTAYIQVAKVSVIDNGLTAIVKGKVQRGKSMEPPFLFSRMISGENYELEVSDLVIKDAFKAFNIPVTNSSGSSIKLKKGDIIGEMKELHETERTIEDNVSAVKLELSTMDIGQLSCEQRHDLLEILGSYDAKMTSQDKSTLKRLPLEHEIMLTDDRPVTSEPRRIPYSQREGINAQLKDLKEHGFIEESMSPYSSAIVPVMKPNGTIRLCVDYRTLNSKIVINTYPIPRVEDLYGSLRGSESFQY